MNRIGTAAWAIPKELRTQFPPEGALLQRYSQVFSAVEINTTFYREHKPETFAKWAEMVPAQFQFSVKLAKTFTHENRLATTSGLKEVLKGYQELGRKLGVLLLQLPPSLEFDKKAAPRFFSVLRNLHSGNLALEPRHLSWTSEAALKLLKKLRIAKVIADPERCPVTSSSAWADFQYFRLHGSPVVYRSNYEQKSLELWMKKMNAEPVKEIWCIFDNTTLGHATANALELQKLQAVRTEISRITPADNATAHDYNDGRDAP